MFAIKYEDRLGRPTMVLSDDPCADLAYLVKAEILSDNSKKARKMALAAEIYEVSGKMPQLEPKKLDDAIKALNGP